MKQTAYSFACAFLLVGLVVTLPAQVTSGSAGWKVSVGGGTLWAPAFPGSRDYQLMVVPDLRVAYGDTFFASVEQGVGYNFQG